MRISFMKITDVLNCSWRPELSTPVFLKPDSVFFLCKLYLIRIIISFGIVLYRLSIWKGSITRETFSHYPILRIVSWDDNKILSTWTILKIHHLFSLSLWMNRCPIKSAHFVTNSLRSMSSMIAFRTLTVIECGTCWNWLWDIFSISIIARNLWIGTHFNILYASSKRENGRKYVITFAFICCFYDDSISFRNKHW